MILSITTKADLKSVQRVDRFTVDGETLTYWSDGKETAVPMSIVKTVAGQSEPANAPLASATLIVVPRPGAAATTRLQAQYGNLPVDQLVDLAWQQAGYLD